MASSAPIVCATPSREIDDAGALGAEAIINCELSGMLGSHDGGEGIGACHPVQAVFQGTTGGGLCIIVAWFVLTLKHGVVEKLFN
mmetsp:Transcript_8068/g.14079  ORF Transcript_8068/g.14079 Transcript_8068/m.14079 type:complete len:85 (-) Transcript_8068:93-347(-)